MLTQPKVVGEPLKIYLAGPLSSDTEEGIQFHIRASRIVWNRLVDMGHYPFSPHLMSGHRCHTDAALEMTELDAEYAKWVSGYDFAWLSLCDAILMLPQWQVSRGSKMEFAEAQRLGLHIFYSEDDVPGVEPGAKPLKPPLVSQPRTYHGHPRFYEMLTELQDLHDRKNHDYAGDGDPLRNLRMCEACGIPAWQGVVVRLTDKLSRLQGFMRQGELHVKDESVVDTFRDTAVYSILGAILFEEAQEPPGAAAKGGVQ